MPELGSAALAQIGQLPRPEGEVGELIAKEQGYFARQAGWMNYAQIAKRGWPAVSKDPANSGPSQASGFAHLNALTEARTNGHWHQLWQNN